MTDGIDLAAAFRLLSLDSNSLDRTSSPNQAVLDDAHIKAEKRSALNGNRSLYVARSWNAKRVARVLQAPRAQPLDVFRHRLFYRVVDSSQASLVKNGTLIARLQPTLALKSVELEQMKTFINHHANRHGNQSTPFMSVTTDLLRALSLAYSKWCQGLTGVTVLVIDSWQLDTGSFIACDSIRRACRVECDNIYKTEVLVWAAIPRRAVLSRWSWAELEQSRLLRVTGSYKRVRDARIKMEEHCDSFPVRKVIRALCRLGMHPLSFATKQVFMFLLGQAKGRNVPLSFESIYQELYNKSRSGLEIFDRTAQDYG